MEKSGQCTVIVNPTSGRERAPKYIPLLHSVLSKRFEDITIKLTEKPGDATHFAEIAAKKAMTSSAWEATAQSMKPSTEWFLLEEIRLWIHPFRYGK